MNQQITITSVTNEGGGASVFSSKVVSLEGNVERMLSQQIPAENFRLRKSNSTYSSDWHVAGDSTLLIILSGTVKIVLRNGQSRSFSAGEMFIADDYLLPSVSFDNALHGHRAEVVGEQELCALHLKLAKRN